MYFSVHTIQILSRFYKTDSEIKQTNSFLHTAESPIENGSLSGCVRAKR